MVEVKGEAYLFLLRKAGTLPEELSSFRKGQGDRRFRFEVTERGICHDMARLEPMTLCYMGRALDH